jgi:hypothetical protein
MSQALTDHGPALSAGVEEISATFASEAALQGAISQLTLCGFDRADISRPLDTGKTATPEQSSANPNTPTDQQQMRTIHTSMAGAVGAIAAAGVTIATGGVASVAVGAAVAVGAGAGLLANLASSAADVTSISTDGNPLILTVRTGTAERATKARDAMAQSGAKLLANVVRQLNSDAKISAV